MSQTMTASATYTVADIEYVVRRVKADLVMIADSTGAWTAEKTAGYVHDIEILAKAGYLEYVDVTLLSGASEVKAVRFQVDTEAGSLMSSRPGGVMWPKVANARLRLTLGYTSAYTESARATIKSRLTIQWVPSSEDTSHAALASAGGRDYSSNSFGMQRKDWTS